MRTTEWLRRLRLALGVSRCAYCRHYIWPNRRIGWYVWADDGHVTMWHTECRREWWLERGLDD